jgi:predicted membrane channel-forming protein YqfA (hemolysin III family)
MTSAQIKAWAKFYAALIGLAAWRGLTFFLYVLTGAGVVAAGKLVDFKAIGLADAGWLLLGTVLASIAGALYSHQPPDPTPPSP